MLRTARYVPPSAINNTFSSSNIASRRCSSCAYALEVLDRFFGRAHRREYIWAGTAQRHPPTMTDANGNTVPHPQANQPLWCFAYGEREWRAGERYHDVLDAATGDPTMNPPVLPVGRIDCATGASLP